MSGAWLTTQLGGCCHRVTDGTHQSPKFESQGIPFLVIRDIVSGQIDWSGVSKWVSRETYEANTARCRPEKGDVLYTAVGSFGVAVPVETDQEFMFQRHIAHIKPDLSRVDPRFLANMLNSPTIRRVAERVAKGVAQRTVTLGDLKCFDVPLPPLPEQKRIAAILDKADAIRRKRQEAIRLTEELLRSAFLDMFGDPVTNPKGWEVKKLGEVVDPDRGVTYGIVQPGPNVADGVPYIKTGDIKNDEIIVHGLCRTSHEIAARYKRSEVLPRDLVFSIRATVGAVAIVPSSLPVANLTQGTARIAPGEAVLLQYLLGYLRSHAAARWLAGQIKGATFKEITLKRLRELPIPLPPKLRQKTYADFWDQQQSVRSRLLDSAESSAVLAAALTQRAFSGKL